MTTTPPTARATDVTEARENELSKLINSFRRTDHYFVDEDCWYSCPVHPDYCGNEKRCNCGLGEHNAKVVQALSLLSAALAAREAMAVERCCGAVCAHCKDGYSVKYHDEPVEIHLKLYRWVHKSKLSDTWLIPCYAAFIRADAARRESK